MSNQRSQGILPIRFVLLSCFEPLVFLLQVALLFLRPVLVRSEFSLSIQSLFFISSFLLHSKNIAANMLFQSEAAPHFLCEGNENVNSRAAGQYFDRLWLEPRVAWLFARILLPLQWLHLPKYRFRRIRQFLPPHFVWPRL